MYEQELASNSYVSNLVTQPASSLRLGSITPNPALVTTAVNINTQLLTFVQNWKGIVEIIN